MLSAGAAGPVDLHLDVLGADLHAVVVLDLRHHLHGGEGGLPPTSWSTTHGWLASGRI